MNYSRSFIYTTAPAPHQIISIKSAYDKLSQVGYSRHKISKLRDLFKAEFNNNPEYIFIESQSPIQCLIIPGNDRVKAICKAVQEDGFDARPIVAPTVPKGKERIRICIHSFNTEEQIIGLASSLKRHLKSIS